MNFGAWGVKAAAMALVSLFLAGLPLPAEAQGGQSCGYKKSAPGPASYKKTFNSRTGGYKQKSPYAKSRKKKPPAANKARRAVSASYSGKP